MKTIKILVLLLSTLIHSIASADDISKPYAVSNIPKQLLLNANAVVRNDQMIQIVENTNESKVKVKQAITLLNDKASKYRHNKIRYNKFVKISNIKAYVYDSKGELLAYSKPSIRDISDNYGDLASDSRYWAITYPIRKYPFTIEIEYEQTSTGYYTSESWGFQPQPDVAVEQSGFQLAIKKGIGFRVLGENLKHPCDTFTLDDKTIYTWQEENIPAQKTEDLLLISFQKKSPYILTSPSEFEMGGIHGNIETWESFGKYVYELNKDRDLVSPELQNKLRQLILNTSDKKEVVKRIYQFLQKNTRYVSIQLGIGGHQALEASFVEKKGYGDCKALTNYMKALLKSVGIQSHQAMIASGDEEDIITSFPGFQFNHVILCVPLENDSIWLECTNQSYPFNFLGGSNGDKNVLLLTEKGGKLVKTPNYRTINNQMHTNFIVNIDIIGNATLKGNVKYNGVAYEGPWNILKSSKEEREEYINNLFASPNIIINNVAHNNETSLYPSIKMECDLTARNFVTKTKRRMIFNPYLFDPAPFISKINEEEFKVLSAKTLTDSVVFRFPVGYTPEHIPAPANIESEFGKFRYECTLENDRIIAAKSFEYFANNYAKEKMDEFIEFVNKIASAERQLIVLKMD